jgi:hypothetical protein
MAFFTVQKFRNGQVIPEGSRYLFTEKERFSTPDDFKNPLDHDPRDLRNSPLLIHWHFYEVPLTPSAPEGSRRIPWD